MAQEYTFTKKELVKAFGQDKANKIWELFKNPHIDIPFDRINEVKKNLRVVNNIIETFGVECEWSPGEYDNKSRYNDLFYCNAGDPYVTTILYWRGKYRLACWGDIVEKYYKEEKANA